MIIKVLESQDNQSKYKVNWKVKSLWGEIIWNGYDYGYDYEYEYPFSKWQFSFYWNSFLSL